MGCLSGDVRPWPIHEVFAPKCLAGEVATLVDVKAFHFRPSLASPPEQRGGGIHLLVLEGRREVIQLGRAQSDLRAECDLAPA